MFPSQPAPNDSLLLDQHVVRSFAFSRATFGPGARSEGIIQHIEKEITELREAINKEDSNDVEVAMEWADLLILSLDGLTRHLAYNVATRDDKTEMVDPRMLAVDVVRLLNHKQARNESREWPNWRDFDQDCPIEHIRTGSDDEPNDEA